MANTILTPTAVTREALRILHQKLNFIGTINRQYDDSFATEGAKIGDTLKIRLPNQYTVRTGATLSTQDTTESSVSLQVATQKGVDVNFTTAELSRDLDDFADRILEPAMAVLAANVESDAISMFKDVSNQVNNVGAAITFANVMNARKKLVDALCPTDANMTCLLNTQNNVDLVDALKGLFHDSASVGKQYREGMMGKTAGFSFYENTLLPRFTTGSDASAHLVNGASQTGTSLIVDTGTGTFKKGDIITLASVNSVHPESKTDTGNLMQFVVTADYAGGAGTMTISPGITVTGGSQNVTASPADNAAITKVGGASAVHGVSLCYHRDAFTFATADLLMPNGVDMKAREQYDGISLRLVRAYDINNDKLPARLDILYGFKTLRGNNLACRIATN